MAEYKDIRDIKIKFNQLVAEIQEHFTKVRDPKEFRTHAIPALNISEHKVDKLCIQLGSLNYDYFSDADRKNSVAALSELMSTINSENNLKKALNGASIEKEAALSRYGRMVKDSQNILESIVKNSLKLKQEDNVPKEGSEPAKIPKQGSEPDKGNSTSRTTPRSKP